MKKFLIIIGILIIILAFSYYAYDKLLYIFNNSEEIDINNIEKEESTPGAEGLKGISIFEIGDTPENIKEKGNKRGIDIFKYDHDYPRRSEIAPELSDALILDFEINKAIQINQVLVHFYRNKLYKVEMRCYSSSSCFNNIPLLIDSFKEKYGAGKSNLTRTNIIWNSGNGVRAEYSDRIDYQDNRYIEIIVETTDVNLLSEILKYKSECKDMAEKTEINEAKKGI